MKKILISLLTIILTSSVALAGEVKTNSYTLTNKEIKQELNTLKTRRLLIANALLLTDLQKVKAEQIYKNEADKEAILYAQLKREKAIYQAVAKEKNSKAKKEQRQIINMLTKDIHTLQHNADKDFKSILNHDQRVKFRRLNNELKLKKV